MGAGILIIVVGVLLGGVMAAAPRGIWWATQSWKFRNPEANEPSELSYVMTRAGGVLLVVFALGFGGVLIADDRNKAAAAAEAAERKRAAEEAEAAFERPPAEIRGLLPVIGYVVRHAPKGVSVDLYYTAPSRSVP
ncbi:DUF6199 family natural product biosynthesis protein [Mycolicibacterium sp. XJ870]